MSLIIPELETFVNWEIISSENTAPRQLDSKQAETAKKEVSTANTFLSLQTDIKLQSKDLLNINRKTFEEVLSFIKENPSVLNDFHVIRSFRIGGEKKIKIRALSFLNAWIWEIWKDKNKFYIFWTVPISYEKPTDKDLKKIKKWKESFFKAWVEDWVRIKITEEILPYILKEKRRLEKEK